MSDAYKYGVLIGSVVAMALVVWILLRAHNRNEKAADYDERQELVRGKAYQYSFLTAVGVALVFMMLDVFELIPFLSVASICVIVVFSGILVFANYCILHDAYYALKENRKAGCTLLIGVVLCAGVGLFSRLRNQPEADGYFQLVAEMCLFFVFSEILILLAAKAVKEKKENDDEES